MYDESLIREPNDGQSERRDAVPEPDGRSVTFARRYLTAEQLQSLREFLSGASSDEIATIRQLYGDMPEVLRSIGLEIGETA